MSTSAPSTSFSASSPRTSSRGVERPEARFSVAPPTDEHPHSIGLVLRYPSGAVVTKRFSSAAEAANFLAAQ